MSESPKKKKTGGARLNQPAGRSGAMDQRKKEKIIMVLMIILAVIMVIAAVVAVFFNRWVVKPDLPSATNTPGVTETDDPRETVSANPTETPSEPEYDPVQPKVSGERISEDIYTIFVFGADESSNLTDTMMIVTYDVTNQKATAMSIPRDTLINTKAYSVDAMKMNCVYSRKGGGEKGTQALINEVSELVGYTPDYYVKVNWELVGLMVDAIGGVYFEIPWDMWYADPYQDLYIDLKEGYQLLDGDQAMQLVRWRKNMNKVTFSTQGEKSVGDTGRLEIQQNFLKAVLKQALQLKNATRVSELAKLFGENVESNLTIENLFWFGTQAIFNGLGVDDVEFVTMPFYFGEYPVKSGEDWSMRSFVYPARKDLLTIINGYLNPFVDEVTLKELDLIYTKSGGGIASTTGTLADPSMATYPEEYLLWKELQENPDATENPDGGEDPDATEPVGGDEDPEITGEPGVTDEPTDPNTQPTNPDTQPTDPDTQPTTPAGNSDGETTPNGEPENTEDPEETGEPGPGDPGFYPGV